MRIFIKTRKRWFLEINHFHYPTFENYLLDLVKYLAAGLVIKDSKNSYNPLKSKFHQDNVNVMAKFKSNIYQRRCSTTVNKTSRHHWRISPKSVCPTFTAPFFSPSETSRGRREKRRARSRMLPYLPFISSVGKSPLPQGISVVPRINPKQKPNSTEINIPRASEMKPTFCKLLNGKKLLHFIEAGFVLWNGTGGIIVAPTSWEVTKHVNSTLLAQKDAYKNLQNRKNKCLSISQQAPNPRWWFRR